ncbi:MAG: protein-L-isoaspartate(D-aspartate) O-methyltransferase [candidate division Zixibacteria bacterium]|nr:protein-L-isoaspartate(D-aspartate) O-methyltransferase [candidate division Zixibacteria bacterium]
MQYKKSRESMVSVQIESRGIKDTLVLKAMRDVPRHRFVPKAYLSDAYADGPLPIGYQQTISQPYIVALMTELMNLKGGEKVLEIGTGSGYQAAVLAEIAGKVQTIEIVPELCRIADSALHALDYDNIEVRCGDGYGGWPEEAPFDAIMITAAPDHIPQALIEQLKENGVLVLPIGKHHQELITVTKTDSGTVRKDVIPVRFVPMTGEAEEH